MAIYRAPRPDTHYTTIRNDVLRDDRLSFRAVGILATILSRPDDWQTSTEELAKRGQEGRDAIRTALRELEGAGYLRQERRQDPRGRWSTQAIVYDEPRSPEPRSIQGDLFAQVTPEPDSQAPVDRALENRESVSQGLTEGTSTKDAPTERAKPPADVIAAAVYERLEKMGNYMAIRQVAGRALKLDGATPELVQAAMEKAVDDSRPLTGQVVRDYLRSGERGSPKDTHAGHWESGGTFTGGGGQP